MREFLRRVALIGILATALTSAFVTAQEKTDPSKVKNPVPATDESIASGKRTYQRYCAVCHGINGKGGSGSDISPPAPSLIDGKGKHSATDGEMFDAIKNGIPPELNMEPWGDRIKDPDIWNVVNYVRSLAK